MKTPVVLYCYMYTVSSNQETKILFRMWETLEMKDKILYRVNSNITGNKNINWVGLNSDVQRWCLPCNQCARQSPGPGVGTSELKSRKLGFL